MLQNFTDVLPFIQASPYAEITTYSLDTASGQGGRFVQFLTGNNSPELSAGNFSAATPGYNYPYVTNLRYENQRKVTFATSGALKQSVVGVTLYGTTEYDLNGQKLILNPYRQVELGAVYSGESLNILIDGIVRLKSTAYSGTPLPGYVAIISPTVPGTLQIWNPLTLLANETTSTGAVSLPTLKNVVARCMSSSGSAFGGYADFELLLKG